MFFIASVLLTIGGMFCFVLGLFASKSNLPVELRLKLSMGWCAIGLLMGILGALNHICGKVSEISLKLT